MTQEIRELIDRILSSYDEIDARFTSAGGLGSILSLYEQVRRELERVSFQELDRMTGEIKNVIEALLTIDYELRKVQNLKLVFDPAAAPAVSKRARASKPIGAALNEIARACLVVSCNSATVRPRMARVDLLRITKISHG